MRDVSRGGDFRIDCEPPAVGIRIILFNDHHLSRHGLDRPYHNQLWTGGHLESSDANSGGLGRLDLEACSHPSLPPTYDGFYIDAMSSSGVRAKFNFKENGGEVF